MPLTGLPRAGLAPTDRINHMSLKLPPLLERIQAILADLDRPVYLVGGAVRDMLLDETSHDLDFATPEEAIRLAFKVADALDLPAYALDEARDTGRVVVPDPGTTLDFARFRGATLEADLRDRDFTVNAIALPLEALPTVTLIDPTNGRHDLKIGLIRQTHPHAVERDPIRALRAFRLAGQLGFDIEAETRASVRAAGPSLSRVSVERIRDEWLNILALSQPAGAIRMMQEFGLLATVLPELEVLADLIQPTPHTLPGLAHSVETLAWMAELQACLLGEVNPASRAGALATISTRLEPFRAGLERHLKRTLDGEISGWLTLRLAALLHDVGKAVCRSVDPDGSVHFYGHDREGARLAGARLRHLKLSNEVVHHVQAIVSGHMRPLHLSRGGPVTRRAVYRFFRDYDSAGLDIGLLTLADHLATYGGMGEVQAWDSLLAVVVRFFSDYFERHTDVVAPPKLVDGGRLMAELGLEPGPQIGHLLRLIQEAQATGEVDSVPEALDLARRMLADHG